MLLLFIDSGYIMFYLLNLCDFDDLQVLINCI